MRFLHALSLLALASPCVLSQWSTPVPVTTGPRDHSVAVANRLSWAREAEDLAFLRTDSGGTDVYVLAGAGWGRSWRSPVRITRSGTAKANPSLAVVVLGSYGPLRKMLVWEEGTSPARLMYATATDSVWGNAAPVFPDSAGDREPSVTPVDTTFVLVWNRRGRIASSRFGPTAWAEPEYVTGIADTLNSRPQVQPIQERSSILVAVWESERPGTTDHRLRSAARVPAGWSTPDTLPAGGHNTGMSFFRPPQYGPMFTQAVWTHTWGGLQEVLWSRQYSYGPPLRWGPPVSEGPGKDPSVSYYWYIDGPPQEGKLGAWLIPGVTPAADSIRAEWKDRDVVMLAGPSPWVNRRPVTTNGSRDGNLVRYWVLWEAAKADSSRIYGVFMERIAGAVEEFRLGPVELVLHQNYPNPFNPATTIPFELARPADVRISVYDILGRQVAVLVDDRREAGRHEVRWGGDFPSGVYYYRLEAGGRTDVKSMTVLR